MDLETENRIAAILMKEAAELRCQAEKEGVHAYLREPNVRFRPNSRFLTATVLGVQQANRVAEVNEMWRVRKKEREVNDELPRPSRDKKYSDSPRSTSSAHREHNGSVSSTGARYREQNNDIPSSSKANLDDSCTSRDGGWKDEEIEQFLHSRVKRGRGGVGARMDEPGPYLPRSDPDSRTLESSDIREKEEWERRVLGPEKPRSLRSDRCSEDDDDQDNWKKSKRVKLESPKKHSKKHKRREDKHARKEKKDRKSKHKHKRRH